MPFARDPSSLSPLASVMVLCAAMLAACGGGGSNGNDGSDGASALVAVSAEPAGSQCTAAGQRIASGIDRNANGLLDAGEIANTQYVCHGSTGAAGAVGAAGSTGLAGAIGATGAAGAAGLATRVKLTAEPVGIHCTTAGTRVDAGLDANTNGALDPSEISSTAYVCSGVAGASGTNGTNGAAGSNGQNTLMSLVAESAGVNCATGGSKVTSGLDANGNSVLDAPEVTSTAYVCHGSNGSSGSNGVSSLVVVVAETAGGNCAAGGSKVTSGLDTNGNGTMDLAEVTSTAYVCQGAAGATGANGANGSNGTNGTNGTNGADGYTTLVLSVGETAGANCAAGGIKITSGRDLSRDGSLDDEVPATSYVCNGLAAIGWVDVTSPTVQAVRNTGYVADNAAQVTVQLPATSALSVGDIVRVSGAGTGGWKIAQAAGQSIVTSNLDVTSVAKTWTDRGYQNSYRSVASSADGNRLVAAAQNSDLFTSADGGLTWSGAGMGALNWTAVASSADGSRLVAVGYNADIYVSVNYGATWQSVAGFSQWVAVASSANGRVLAAARAGGQIDVSEDYGATWASRGSNKYWSTIALSADGSRIVAAENGGTVDVSSDFGITWSSNSPTAAWRSVATSGDGRRLVAVAEYAPIYTSDDFGVTWTARETLRFWGAVTSSADGTRLLAAVTLDQNAAVYDIAFLYASSDQGVTWTQRATDDNWSAVALSADGARLVAVTNAGTAGISTSVPRRMTATTTGIAGSIIGRQDQALELQYVGSGRFIVLAAIGGEFEAN